ncbi:hypothetical protein H3146_24420 [Streptomyces sp. OF3]|uniref:Uncharacterized protein n=1 Tax=Streptomyces alkaliterrae TaxID=2213162 RepID=A0A7W3WQ74_9ACTN|nr:hypothetical protein [Streptomyces alkaliterrae]MBB1256473.1 hypothetical protein [Streptomyces alkaliterrae]
MITPGTTPTPRIGEPRCGSRNTASEPACGQPATWHIAWRLTPPANFSLACDDHMTESQAKFVYADRHRAEVACDMPGTGWLIEQPSRCVVPADETDRAYLAASEVATP